MIVNLYFICSMKSFWSASSIMFIFFERKTVFCTSVIESVIKSVIESIINWERDNSASKLNQLDILTIDWVSEISNNWSILSSVRLLDCFVRCLREGILSMIYRFDEESDMYIYMNELLLESYRIIRDRLNCKNYQDVIQCDQQQHRYIISFDR